ncbi:hypothetical protein [Peribacillus acanthi]|uniref:hypothetical protein n=1 Tax=Peribacillus acanthi TaxID=2171554 RepID=UPI000D3EB22B|nr:hypothetical protein [Peribacillus acanthi]
MLRILVKYGAIVLSAYLGYRYRYRLLNVLLGVPFLRRSVVASSMNMPLVKDKMLQSMFKLETSPR